MGVPAIEFPDRYNAATDLLYRHLEEGRGTRTALRSSAGEWTYQELATNANRAGNALKDLGVQVENRVLMAVLDSHEFAALFFGAIKLGAIPVPVNTNLKPKDYAYFLNDSRARVAVVSQPLADQIREVRGELEWLEHLVVIGEAGPEEISYAEITSAAKKDLAPARTGKDDMCFWLYSSGTTGFPKGAVHLQHDMRICTELYAKQILGMNESDTTYSVAKLYFAYGLGNALFFPIAVGAQTVMLAGPPAPPAVFDLIRRFKATIFYAVPTWYANTLAADPELWAQSDLSSLRICVSAGEPLSSSIWERWKAKTGVELLDGIGSTEIGHIFISNRIGSIKRDSTGQIVPGYEARIVDEHGLEVPEGEVGTLMVKGESTCAFYWNQHERTKRTIQGEWINTGDKYIHDAEGYFSYQGRADDMMKVGGIWVSPTEVEGAINQHDAVLECAVVGLVDDQSLIHPVAYVVLQRGHEPSVEMEEALRAHVRERLAHFKCPHDFHFVSDLPKTATGKIQRYKLRQAGEPAAV